MRKGALSHQMKIKQRPKTTRKQKSYLKWMGMEKPKKIARLPQLNKFHKKQKRLLGQSRGQDGGWLYE